MAQKKIEDVLEYSDGSLVWKISYCRFAKQGKVAGCPDKAGYLRVRVFGKTYPAHHIVWYLHHGYWPEELDHEDRNNRNNRIENLRECTTRQNAMNRSRRSDNTSGFKGVNWHKAAGKWAASVCIAGKRKHLGLFSTAALAAKAYDEAARKYHGEFAYVNFNEEET